MWTVVNGFLFGFRWAFSREAGRRRWRSTDRLHQCQLHPSEWMTNLCKDRLSCVWVIRYFCWNRATRASLARSSRHRDQCRTRSTTSGAWCGRSAHLSSSWSRACARRTGSVSMYYVGRHLRDSWRSYKTSKIKYSFPNSPLVIVLRKTTVHNSFDLSRTSNAFYCSDALGL